MSSGGGPDYSRTQTKSKKRKRNKKHIPYAVRLLLLNPGKYVRLPRSDWEIGVLVGKWDVPIGIPPDEIIIGVVGDAVVEIVPGDDSSGQQQSTKPIAVPSEDHSSNDSDYKPDNPNQSNFNNDQKQSGSDSILNGVGEDNHGYNPGDYEFAALPGYFGVSHVEYSNGKATTVWDQVSYQSLKDEFGIVPQEPLRNMSVNDFNQMIDEAAQLERESEIYNSDTPIVEYTGSNDSDYYDPGDWTDNDDGTATLTTEDADGNEVDVTFSYDDDDDYGFEDDGDITW